MTNRTMAFGTRTDAMFVRAPLKNVSAPLPGYGDTRNLTNGQLVAARSPLRRKRYEFVYKGTEVELREIMDFVLGRYGNGPYMFIHPRSLNGNMLPRTWSQFNLVPSARGNQAIDLYSGQVSLTVSGVTSIYNNPSIAALALTGATGLPATGVRLWCVNNNVPVTPPAPGSRPFHTLLVPPNYQTRITLWGSQNNGSSPRAFYSLSNVGPANTTVAAGTALVPTTSGATVTIASSASWRTLDIWIGAGAATTATEWTIFSAMDVRMKLNATPALPTVFDFGRGQFDSQIVEDNLDQQQMRIGADDTKTFYQIAATVEEVTKPW